MSNENLNNEARIGLSLLNAGLGLSFPKYEGQWQIGGRNGLVFSVCKKPKWLTRWLCHKLLEWEWIDIPNS